MKEGSVSLQVLEPGGTTAVVAAGTGVGGGLHRRVQYLLVVGYLGFVVLGLVTPWQPRVFWTVLLPLLPLGIVLMGFSSWRRICPLAFFGEAGRALRRGLRLADEHRSGGRRRVPPWLERWFLPFTFAVLAAMLVLRLVATNGDGRWLSGLLLALALAAVATNAFWTGKTWCNFVCPVGLVERIYTEPGSLAAGPNSQCTRCTACKRHCPDIDQENAYWKDATGVGRRLAFYAFPGLVLAFYAYFWLRQGDWEAYFDGRWTRQPFTADLAFGPGFFFAPAVPAVVAATLTLLIFSVASYALFVAVEAVVARFVADTERRRHLTLALAAFTAWNLFYLFAGAPTLRGLPYGTRGAAFVAPLLGTIVLAKRWKRTHERYIAEQGATRMLRNWEFEEPPPSDAGEVYGFIKASRQAREKEIAAYANTVRDMIADGLVAPGQLRLLEGVRRQLGISEREHEKVLARLSEEERHLFEPGAEAGVERRAQLMGYQSALAEIMLRGAPRSEVDELRRSFGVTPEEHATTLERLRGAAGPLIDRARRQLDRAVELRRTQTAIGGTEPTAARVFLASLLTKAGDEALDRVLELLEIAGDGPMIQALRRRLFSTDATERGMALELLAAACPGAASLTADLEPLFARHDLGAEDADGDSGGEVAALETLLRGSDPYLTAAAVWAAAAHPEEASLCEGVARARLDDHPLVRETAERFGVMAAVPGTSPASVAAPSGAGSGTGPPAYLSTIETMHLLHAVALFSGLDPDDLHELALYAIEETIAPPRAIFEQGEADVDALFVILSGRVAVYRREALEALGSAPGEDAAPGGAAGGATSNGHLVETLGPGAVVGELSVLDGTRREVTVLPVGGPVRVLLIPGARFRGGLLRRPRVTEWLLGVLAGRIRQLAHRVGHGR